MTKLISLTKSHPKFFNTTQYKAMFSPDFAVGWHAIDRHLRSMLPNCAFHHYKNSDPNDLLDNIAVCEWEDGHLYCVSYGLSALYYNEASYGNLISKYGFELTFHIVKALQPFSLEVYVQFLQEIAKLIIHTDLDTSQYQHKFELNESTLKLLNHQYTYFSLSADPILKKMGSPHGQHQFIEIHLHV
ncbi:suppressor of fused domain protein [Acinetobacter sp. 187]|uniref:suppressor of fused domain protein n=1 Tax=Acinetobacter lanii TaxID=2715163 RepID=UPI001407852F|nr:suppressor of fused domain protein [Acinetobacter lanii]NHC03173.1 suppressor of fused domain protein [Acinetobacter lanii]